MWIFGLFTILGVWVFTDARQRKANPIVWAIGTLLFAPMVLPFYFAKRPLKNGEVREGGFAWNTIRGFAVTWTIVMITAAVLGLAKVGDQSREPQSSAERTGTAIGTTVGLGLIGAIWFFPVMGALVLGLILKKSSEIEKG